MRNLSLNCLGPAPCSKPYSDICGGVLGKGVRAQSRTNNYPPGASDLGSLIGKNLEVFKLCSCPKDLLKSCVDDESWMASMSTDLLG